MSFTRKDFGDSFNWGVSTAAYQIEGAHNVDGKGPSIWDKFSQKKRNILLGENGNEACNFYEKFEEDIALIRQLNIPIYRFSISWSRVFPDGIGQVNPKGIDFYNRLINSCLAQGVVPWVTLYHWDLPDALQQKGGWVNRSIVQWFSEFVECCIKNFGDRVKHWMILNEPMVFTGAGYFLGVHAPGKKGLGNFLAAAHHAALCQAEGGRIVRSLCADAKIGTTFSYSHLEPYRPNLVRDIKATAKVDALLNRMFIEPLLGMGYPTKDLAVLNRIERYMKPDDEVNLAFDMDFIGLQNYTRELIKYSPFVPFVNAKIIKASKRNVPYTQMDWEVYPPSIYEALKKFNSYPAIKEIIVTENGVAFKDALENGRIEDTARVNYLNDHIEQVLRAKKEGVKVNGYFVWTLMDNFEWAEGFTPKFGLIHIDFKTQQRIVKDSGKWYAQFLNQSI